MKTRMNISLTLLLAICMVALMFPVVTLACPGDNFEKMTAISLDGRPYPAYDYSRANKLPMEMTGYWEKSFTMVDGKTRTAKIYISPETPIRSYYTVIAVPDGFDTEEFLWRSGWKAIADEKEEGLFVLEPGEGGWGGVVDELEYVTAAMNFYISNRYFSIFGEHYLVGYGAGAPALEAWAAANPLKVISQVYVDSKGLEADYLNQFYTKEFDGKTAPPYITVVFPAGFDLIKYTEVVLPTWYIHPDRHTISESLDYWKNANDCVKYPVWDKDLGFVYKQAKHSGRWMTSYSGSISKVAVQNRRVNYWNKETTRDIVDFLTYYTRYENFFAYGNQLVIRADYDKLGIEIHTMMVNGYIREYMVYVPHSAKHIWGHAAPVMWVWAGNSQTDKVFLDATQWWKVAKQKGFILVIPCEQYSNTSVSVSHKDNDLFFRQLREVILRDYGADPTRFYSTGQSAGSMASQSFAIAKPEYYAAIASTSGTSSPDANGNVIIDGISGTGYPATYQMIPNYMINGGGDMGQFVGTLWDSTNNGLDSWAAYFLGVDGFVLGDVDNINGVTSGWHDRFVTCTWNKTFGAYTVPLFKVTNDKYRSHNCIHEEMPLLWDFAEHYSCEVDLNNKVTRYYSASGFRVKGDKVRIYP